MENLVAGACIERSSCTPSPQPIAALSHTLFLGLTTGLQKLMRGLS
jgi:hypothetical protein